MSPLALNAEIRNEITVMWMSAYYAKRTPSCGTFKRAEVTHAVITFDGRDVPVSGSSQDSSIVTDRGGGGNRTRVRSCFRTDFYARRLADLFVCHAYWQRPACRRDELTVLDLHAAPRRAVRA